MNQLNRWSAGTAITAAVAFALLLPKQSKDPIELSERIRAWSDYEAASDEVRAVGRLLRRAEARAIARDLPAVAAESPLVRIHRSIPREVANRVRQTFSAELRDVGATAPKYPVALVVAIDTMPRAIVIHRAVALPESAGAPCTVAISVPSTKTYQLPLDGRQRLLGTCAFFAAFGAPGTANAAWLRATRFESAKFMRRPYAFTGDTMRVDLKLSRVVFSGADAAVYSCRAGRALGCDALFTSDPIESPLTEPRIRRAPYQAELASFEPGTEDYLAFTSQGAPLDFRSGMLAALADELGPARFGELWRGPASLADGYAALTGQPLTSWVASYVAERTLPYHAGPGLRVLPALLGVVLSLLALGLTLRFAPRRMT